MSKIAVTESSGNVFADIGLPNAEEHKRKADLVIKIAKIIAAEGMTQAAAAKRIGVSQPEISKMLRGHFASYSLERLLVMLTKLGRNVTIKIDEPKRASKKPGQLVVST
jgi:predicted XRE-type DNA-binding protein